jgi:N-acyl-D-amino-acid deacylase
MRSEEDKVFEAVEETLATARASKVNLQISHIKANYPRNWAKIDGMLAAIDQAAKEGIRVTADRYPYIAFSTGLNYYFPEWAREGTAGDFVSRLRDASLQTKLRVYVKGAEEKLGSWDRVLLSSILSEKNRALEGSTVLAAASSQKKPPYEFMRDLLIEEEGIVGMVGFGMCEENLKKFYAHPLVTVGSDGNAVAPYGVLGRGKPHPRYYGTFPRYLGRYVLDEKVLPIEEAIRRITSFTAEKFGLSGRGKLAEGYFADVTVFDINRIMDRATFEKPHQYPDGVVYVLVNGKVAIRNSEHTGALQGKILKRGAATA